LVDTTDIRWWVEGFDPGADPRAQRSREAILALLGIGSAACTRSFFAPGHVTASGLVLSEDGSAVLLVFHERLQRWLQPGGHLEPVDATIAEAARREVREETGVVLSPVDAPVLAGMDVHEIPAARGEPRHKHHDLMFRFVVRGPLPTLAGTHRAVWAAVARLDEYGVDESLRRAVVREGPGLASAT
jgi:8-oxo-dGTP pyrophosphatase MutT (NUDIX family)